MGKSRFIVRAGIALFILSLFYLGAETIFNMSLLDVAGSVRSSPEDITHIQRFGRTVSAFGCYLLVLGLFVNAGFSWTQRREKRILLSVMALSAAPFLMMVFGHVPVMSGSDVFLGMMPFFGMLAIFIGRRFSVIALPLGLFLMVWAAVYTGQKLLIEEILVDRTGWEERVNARYALMLRAGFEGCSIKLDDLKLCDTEGRQDIVKSARIILGALWMLNPEGIRRDMIDNREKLIHAAATSGIGISLKDSYQKYLDKVGSERKKYIDEMIEKYYAPYKTASNLYAQNANTSEINRQSETAANDIDARVTEGWEKYTNAVRGYKQAAGSMAIDAARNITPWQKKVQDFCNGRRCPVIVNKNTAGMLSQAQMQAENKFLAETGYRSNIATEEEFAADPQTQGMIRSGIEDYIHEKMGVENFVLPYNWRYDRAGLRQLFQNLAAVQVNTKWREKFGKLPPGLSPEDFFAQLGYAQPPEVKDIAMSEQDFFDKILLPKYKQEAARMFDEIEAEKKLYANGAAQEDKGRNFVRAAYIPAISLVVSLMVVSMTIVRWSAAGLALALKRAKISIPRAGRAGIVAVFVVILLSLPYLAPNAYISGTAYQRYLKGAAQGSPVMAGILDWALHAQPVIYKFGMPLRKLLG